MKGFNCLAVETSTAVYSLAACCADHRAELELAATAEPSRDIFLKIRELLESLELESARLDCIAFGCGPGAFTGLRIGASVAQSLAFGLGLPVCRISSLAALAFAVEVEHPALIAVCTDARMGEVYSGLYKRAGDEVRPVLPDRLLAPDELELPGDSRVVAVGSGWGAHPELQQRFSSRMIACDPEARPEASAVMALAAIDFAAGRHISAFDALPNYLRDRVTG